jgi:hypothetical protein
MSAARVRSVISVSRDGGTQLPADEPPPPSPEELEREMEYFVEPEEAFTREEAE